MLVHLCQQPQQPKRLLLQWSKFGWLSGIRVFCESLLPVSISWSVTDRFFSGIWLWYSYELVEWVEFIRLRKAIMKLSIARQHT